MDVPAGHLVPRIAFIAQAANALLEDVILSKHKGNSIAGAPTVIVADRRCKAEKTAELTSVASVAQSRFHGDWFVRNTIGDVRGLI